MKQKICLIILLTTICSSFLFAEKKTTTTTTTIEDWVSGSILGENSLFLFLDNVTQPEFIQYADLNDISSFTVSVFWRNDANMELTQIGSNIVNDIDVGFEVDSWSFTIDGDYNIDPNITPPLGSIGTILPGTYQFQIIYNNEICGPLVDLPVIVDTIVEEEEDLPIELPEYNCGEDYTPDPITDMTSDPIKTGDILTISGFPILVEQGGSNGSGIIPVPFGKKAVSVTFNGIQANVEGVVFAGTVSSNSDSPANYPDFNLVSEPLNIGGDICLPAPPEPGYNTEGVDPVTGLDPRGFDPNTGLHTNGSPYDDNGFGLDGTYLDTGQQYNEQGCNYDGFDAGGNKCDVTGPPFVPAGVYAESISDSLENVIPGLLTSLLGEIQTELTNLECDEIRNVMDNLVANLQFTREFVFGEADTYFEKGMHLNFKERPQPLILNIERNADAKLLEEKHIELYDCDKREHAFEALTTAINEIINNTGYHDVFNDVKDAISNWTEYQYNLYTNDPAAFNEWLLRLMGDLMKDESGLDDSYDLIGSAEEVKSYKDDSRKSRESLQSIFDFNRSNNLATSAIASSDKHFLLEDKFTLEDASFLYLQGEKNINGFDRALFMEEINMQRMLIATEANENLTPIVVSKTVANKTYYIYLDNMSFSPTGATLDAHAVIEDPESGKKLIFSTLGLSFSPTGLTADAKLFLGTDIEVRLNNAAMFILKGTDETYVEFDCDGFKSMGIDAEIEFCRNFITPLDPTTLEPKPEEERYRLDFKLQEISSWLEFTLELDAEPFAVTKFSDVKWELTQMVIDMSSTYTPAFTPLPGYTSPFYDEDANVMSPCWKGFYMNTLSATFPNSFSSSEEKITASANDILIDGCGFTGSVSVDNLITLDDGDMGGWPFSITAFELTVLKNQFGGAGFGGEVKIPIFEEPMDYEAVMYPQNNYKFTVTPNESVTMDLFLATGEIYEDSKIEVGYDDEGFHTVATLNGKLTPSTVGSSSSFSLELPSMCFQDFRVSNRAPYFDAGNWGLVGADGNEGAIGASFNGFEIRVSDIQPYSAEETVAGIDLNIDVVVSGKIDVAAGGGFGIEGELTHDANNRQQWVFKRIDVHSFYVDATFPSGYVKGELEWFGDENNPDPVWGKGFRGAVAAGFEALDGMQLMAAAQFGQMETFKYFYIDALLDLGAASIPLGPLALQGFGGGLSYHMDTQQNAVLTSGSSFTLPPIGGSFSSTTYSVDQTKGLGLKATALISTSGVQSVFNGAVSLSFLFHEGGGMDKIELTGSGQFLADPTESIAPNYTDGAQAPPAGAGSLSCFINLTYNFDQPSFDGTLQAFLNSPYLNGSGTGGKMVDATMHFDPEKWYIYIGRPEEGQRCGVIFDLGLGGTGIQSSVYLDVGTEVPPMAELPEEVREIAYLVNTNQSLRNSGQGFVFGAAVDINLEASIAGIITTSISAKAGFDMMLRKYEGYTCAGTSDEVGINGWYGSGQMYAYISGELKAAGFQVAELAIAAVLQARLPNPFWAQATVGVKIKLLGGLIEEDHSLKFELGDDCELVTSSPSPELGINIISHLDPVEAAQDVETNLKPLAYFNVPIGEDITIDDINGNTVTYKAELLSAKLVSAEGFDLAGQVLFNSNNKTLTFSPNDLLYGNNEHIFTVEVEIFKDGVYLSDESQSVTFTTGETLDYIPEANVLAAYPANGMANFHREEYNYHEGYLYLESGQPELMVYLPEGYVNAIRLTASTGEVEYLDFEYDIISRKITYDLDPSILTNEKVYKVELLRIRESILSSLTGSSSTASSTTSGNTSPNTGTNTASALLTSAFSNEPEPTPPPPANYTSANTTQPLPPITNMYTMYFRVSKYDSFKEKLNAITSTEKDAIKDLSNYEIFGELEVNGNNSMDKLITIVPDLSGSYFTNQVETVLESFRPYDCAGNRVQKLSDFADYNIVSMPTDEVISKNSFDDQSYTFAHGSDTLMELDYDRSIRKFLGTNLGFLNDCGIINNMIESYSHECEVAPNDGGNPCSKLEEILEIPSALFGRPPISSGTYALDFIYAIPNRYGKQTTTVQEVTFRY